MAGARLSPTAHLLRTSRLFSLPSPLPQPNQSSTILFDSTTATLPYPRVAAIETTQSSLSGGDWGLKRALPLRSTTNTSTPLIRIGDVDSIYHITEFESAADHTLTLRKWQEIGVPIAIPSNVPRRATKPGYQGQFNSVFESKVDNSHKNSGDSGTKRWKFSGPWLAGQTEGDFQRYILNKVTRRKLEFKDFLREDLSERVAARQRRISIEEGREIGHDTIVISDKDLEVYIRHLRQDPETLHRLIEKFLDLPSESESHSQASTEDALGQNVLPRVISDAVDIYEQGPPTTHPSAGLSYLRTPPHIRNHPVIGPQQYQQPVQARVLAPQTTTKGRKNSQATLGVGGVAANDDPKSFWKSGDVEGVTMFDPDIPGGAKVWVDLDRASIDPRGRIRTQTSRTHPHALAICKGIVRDENIPTNLDGKNRDFPDSAQTSQSRNKSRQGYYGLESDRPSSFNSRAKPLQMKSSKVGPQDILDLLKPKGI